MHGCKWPINSFSTHPYSTSSPHNTSFQRLPIHDKRIGKPIGDAVIRDGVFYRSFAAGVNVTYIPPGNKSLYRRILQMT